MRDQRMVLQRVAPAAVVHEVGGATLQRGDVGHLVAGLPGLPVDAFLVVAALGRMLCRGAFSSSHGNPRTPGRPARPAPSGTKQYASNERCIAASVRRESDAVRHTAGGFTTRVERHQEEEREVQHREDARQQHIQAFGRLAGPGSPAPRTTRRRWPAQIFQRSGR